MSNNSNSNSNSNSNYGHSQGKKGGNKGIAKARKLQKRVEAEARNALTPPERRRKYRRLTFQSGSQR